MHEKHENGGRRRANLREPEDLIGKGDAPNASADHIHHEKERETRNHRSYIKRKQSQTKSVEEEWRSHSYRRRMEWPGRPPRRRGPRKSVPK